MLPVIRAKESARKMSMAE